MAKAAYWTVTDVEARKRGNSKELTGTRTSGGACGLIRSNAKNLTKS